MLSNDPVRAKQVKTHATPERAPGRLPSAGLSGMSRIRAVSSVPATTDSPSLRGHRSSMAAVTPPPQVASQGVGHDDRGRSTAHGPPPRARLLAWRPYSCTPVRFSTLTGVGALVERNATWNLPVDDVSTVTRTTLCAPSATFEPSSACTGGTITWKSPCEMLSGRLHPIPSSDTSIA